MLSRLPFVFAVLLSAAQPSATSARATQLVVWAWERPEDLRFLPPDAEIALETGFVRLIGDRVEARGRRFPLLTGAALVTTAVVHVQIDPAKPLLWSPELRARTAAAILQLSKVRGARWLQLDFEVRASQRGVLMDVLRDLRAGLPPNTRLSMTALASWCETETWLGDAPVDEIAPMLFRMGPAGAAIRARLAAGGDFANPRCRGALAISSDTPIARAPSGRRVYLFDPRGWTPADFKRVSEEVSQWDAR